MRGSRPGLAQPSPGLSSVFEGTRWAGRSRLSTKAAGGRIPTERDGHACPSGPPAALSASGRPPPTQDRYLVDARPSRPGHTQGPPREPRAHGTGSATPSPASRGPAHRRDQRTGLRAAWSGPRGSAAGGEGGATWASRQQPPPSEATDAAGALSRGPAPPGRAAPPRPGGRPPVPLGAQVWAGPGAGGAGAGPRPLASQPRPGPGGPGGE